LSAIAPLKDERWWGAYTALGSMMPFDANTKWHDMNKNNLNNQTAPLLLSSHGRWVWSAFPIKFRMSGDTMQVISNHEMLAPAASSGGTLKSAYMQAMQAHFPPQGIIPPEEFFAKPQYNTWIELMYNQNQTDIEAYAQHALQSGMPAGALMIDDNWQKYYGNFEFKPDKFPDPRGMTERLHSMGFKIMLWVCPFVSGDSPEFRELEKEGFLVKDKNGNTAVIHWWNGYSACYDMTNPNAANHLEQKLRETQQRYGIDGFKFDGGDAAYMQGNYIYDEEGAGAAVFSQRWAEFAMRFDYNELRAAFKAGGLPLVQRLGDKDYSWHAVQQLIPDMMAAGLLGYWFLCPDMIGGGQYSAFLGIDSKSFDQELIVRSCQIHAMMPMMQFSAAPWRILDEEHLAACRKAVKLHEKMSGYILETARHAAKTGEPIVRSMEYACPHEGFAACKDQYMLGAKYMAAPMVSSGGSRMVKLPKGRWKDDLGRVHDGGRTIEVAVPLDRIPYFERIK
jgi:alpha-glucosidase